MENHTLQKIEHLKMIQAVITRMGSNSFFVKGWAITLTAAILVVAVQKQFWGLSAAAAVPAFLFWQLDGFYLRQERMFRALYDAVRVKPATEPIDFSMDTRPYVSHAHCEVCVLLSASLRTFHGAIFLAVLFTTLYIYGR